MILFINFTCSVSWPDKKQTNINNKSIHWILEHDIIVKIITLATLGLTKEMQKRIKDAWRTQS